MSSAQPRISVIVPVLDAGRYIERCLCSVIDQGYDGLELFVMDGGSRDETVPIIQHYDDEITYWRSQSDRGPAEAINDALKRATGEWVMVLGADDLLLPGALHEVARRLSGESPDWLVATCQRIGRDDGHVGRTIPSSATSLRDYLLDDRGAIPLKGSIFRRSVFAAHGRFDATLRHAYGQDLVCRLLADGVRPMIVSLPLVANREMDASAADHVIASGREDVAVTERYSEALPIDDREALWAACDERRRIYHLAEAESRVSETRRFLWQQLLRRPSWLASEHYRRTLLGLARPMAERHPKRAAA